MKSIRPARPFRVHQNSAKALLIALLLVSALLFQSMPGQRGGLVLAKAANVAENHRSDAQPAQNPSGDAGRSELRSSATAAQPSKTPNAPQAPLAAVIVATNRDSFPIHGDLKVHENDAIDYSIAITNTGDTDATGVSFTDVVDPNTSTLVGGATVQFSVIADPNYGALGNDRLDTTTLAPGSGQTVLENDTLNGSALTGFGDTLTNANNVVPNGTNTVTTTNGGTVKMNANGSFIYDPAPGFGGAGVTDTFWYTLTKSTIGTGNPNGFPRGSARVTIAVSTPIWFINSAAAVGGNGTLASPFNCYTGTSNGAQTCFSDTAADDPGDPIFLYNGNYIGGYALLANQKLIGQGSTASLASLTGATVPPGNTALPATNGTPSNVTITTAIAATNAIPVSAGGILLRGFTVGNTTGAKIFGSSFGTLTVGDNVSPDVVLNGTGQALNLTTGTFAATSGFNSVTSTSSGTQGIALAGVGGTAVFGSTTISGNTTQCILVGTTTANINFGNTSCTGGTDGVSFQNNASGTRTFGTLSVSGNSAAGFLSGAGGGTVTVNGAATFNSAGNNIDIQNLTNPTTITFASTVGVTKTTTGGFGVNLATNPGSTINFNSLGITTSNGPALNATGGGTINVTTNAGAISATGIGAQTAAAILGNGVTLAANFSSVSCNGSGTGGNCISLTTVTGTSNFGGGTLAGAAGATFLVSGGTASVTYAGGITQANAAAVVSVAGGHSGTLTFNTGTISATNGTGFQFDNADGSYNFNGTNSVTSGASSGINIQNGSGGTLVFSTNTSITNPSAIAYREDTSTPTVTYGGTISKNTAANAVAINAKTGGTTNFNGGITATTTTANAITLTSNTAGTINFNGSTSTGGLALTTTSGIGFNATGGGTISATQNNTSIVNSITSTTGTALNVANTTISATNLTFRSITSSTASANSGIILNTTGANGGLIVTGNGGACASAATCTGGNISSKTTDGISLTSTFGTSLTNMFISSNTVNGINGTTVTNFTLSGCTMNTNGTVAGNNGVKFTTLLGTSTISNNTINQSAEDNLHIDNTSGTLTLLTVSGNTFSNTRLTGPGNDGFLFQGHNAAIATIVINGNNNFNNNALIGLQVQALDTSNITVTVQTNTFLNNNEGIEVEGNSGAKMVAHIGGTTNPLGNTFSAPAVPAGNAGCAILASTFPLSTAASDFNVKIEHNNITIPSGAVNHGLIIFGSGTSAPLKALVDGNTITNNGQFDGIHVNTPDTGTTPTMNVTVTNNTVNSADLSGASPTISINCNYRRADTGTFKIEGNTTTSANGGNGIQLRRTLGTVRLERGGSASAVPSVVLAANNPAATGTGGNINVVTDGTITVVNNGTILPPSIAPPAGDDGLAVATPIGTTSSATQQVAAQIAQAPATQQVTAQTAQAAEVAREVNQATARVNLSSAIATAAPSNRTSRNDVRMAHAPGRTGAARAAALASSRVQDSAPNAPTVGGTVGPVALGTVTAGSSVVLTFQVTVNTKAPLGASQVVNQGQVSGSNFALVNGVSTGSPNTDDPDIAGAANPTVTPLLHPSAADGVITGRIADDQGNPVEGAVVRLDGTQNRKFITDANGVYRFENVETSGFYTVTPSRVNYSFNPGARSFSQMGETTNAAFGATATGQNANPLDTPEYFVRQNYLDFLGREPDEAGFNFWSDQILGCGNDTNCISVKRENVSAAYFLSIEFHQTGGLVDGMYRASYGARPTFAQFMPDSHTVGLGVVVGKAGWEAKLAANKQAYAQAFVNTAAFHAAYDGMDNSLFVDTLISHTGVSFTAGERDALVSGLSAGTMSRAEALRSIAENNHFADAKVNDAFVMMEYFGYLRRDPDTSGFGFWLDKLNQFGGNFERAEMVKAFIVSGEYRDRFPK